MITYTLNDFKILSETMDTITGKEEQYPLVAIILEELRKLGVSCDINKVTKKVALEYMRMSNDVLLQKDFEKMNIEAIMYSEPLQRMPLYLNYDGIEIIKKVAATWRLMIGKQLDYFYDK